MPLNDTDRRILEFEGGWWTWPGPKSEGIRRRLAMSPTRYYRRLGELAESAEALEHAPLVVLRIRRRQAEQRRVRFEGTPIPARPRR